MCRAVRPRSGSDGGGPPEDPPARRCPRLWGAYRTPPQKSSSLGDPPSAQLPSPLKPADKVRLYDERVRGFQLDIAQQMLGVDATGNSRNPWAGFASLAVVFSYFEAYEQHRSGVSTEKGCSGRAFQCGVLDVFPRLVATGEQLDALWKRLRCGQSHCGNPKGGIVIGPGYQDPLEYAAADDTWYINPEKLIVALQEHHKQYVSTLVSPSPALTRFEKIFDKNWRP